jgi:hypothetical protein
MTKLTLHIGIHRTGTTGLQRNLAANRERLASLGYAYPGDQSNHQDIAWALFRGEIDGQDVLERLKPHRGVGHIILSGEDFCIHTDLAWVEALRRDYDLQAVVYLRRQDHWVMSWYNQHLKWPFSRRHSVMTPKEFLDCLEEFYWLDFDDTVERWQKAVGTDRLKVRVIDKGQVRDAVADFLSIVGLRPQDLTFDESQQNDSLPTETLEFVRRIGMIDLRPGKRMNVINFLRELGRSKGLKAKTLYTAAERQGILDRFEKGNRNLARRLFGRDELFLEGPPDDKDLYVEGNLARQVSFDDIMMSALQALTK